MRIVRPLAAAVCALLVGTGCEGAGHATPDAPSRDGGVSFGLELAALQAASAVTITAASATLTRAGHSDIMKPLAVANGLASGQVDGLEAGYWHVTVDVSGGTSTIFKGAADVNVVAGTTVQCTILFDPVVTPTTSGSVAITVGINPMPGFTVLNQAVGQILFDRAGSTFYVPEGASTTIAVYDADTLVRERDLAAPAPPSVAALSRDGAGIYLGYPSGRVYRVDVASGATSLVGDALMQLNGMTSLDGGLFVVTGPGSYGYTTLKVMDAATGQIRSTRSTFYSLTDLLYNPAAKTVYAHHQGVSPTDIHYVKFDPAGVMTSDGDSIYHGDYSFGSPLRVINGGARIATSSGAMFTSAELVASDLRYCGSLGISYLDLIADEARGKLYVLNGGTLPKLLVIDQTTYFTERTVDLAGTPSRVFDTGTSIVVFATKDGRTYARTFSKAALGL